MSFSVVCCDRLPPGCEAGLCAVCQEPLQAQSSWQGHSYELGYHLSHAACLTAYFMDHAYQCPACEKPLIPQAPQINRLVQEGLIEPLREMLEQGIGRDYTQLVALGALAVKHGHRDVFSLLHSYRLRDCPLFYSDGVIKAVFEESRAALTFDMARFLVFLEDPDLRIFPMKQLACFGYPHLRDLILEVSRDFRVNFPVAEDRAGKLLCLLTRCFAEACQGNQGPTAQMLLEEPLWRHILKWGKLAMFNIISCDVVIKRISNPDHLGAILQSLRFTREEITNFVNTQPLSIDIRVWNQLVSYCQNVLGLKEEEIQSIRTSLIRAIEVYLPRYPEVANAGMIEFIQILSSQEQALLPEALDRGLRLG